MSRELDARAFTVGQHIAFAPGHFRPGTLEGDALLGHELAHTVQQADAKTSHGSADHAQQDLERQADAASLAAMTGGSAIASGMANAGPELRIQRDGGVGEAILIGALLFGEGAADVAVADGAVVLVSEATVDVVAAPLLETAATPLLETAATPLLETAATPLLETAAAPATDALVSTAAEALPAAATQASTMSTMAQATIATATIAGGGLALSSDQGPTDDESDRGSAYPIVWPLTLPPPPQKFFVRFSQQRDEDEAKQARMALDWRAFRDPDFDPRRFHVHHVVPLFLGGRDDLATNGIVWPKGLHLTGHARLRDQPQMLYPPVPLAPLPPDLYDHPQGTRYWIAGYKP